MLIASLPPVHQDGLLREIIDHPIVDAVRYNTGMDSAYDPYETLRRISDLAGPLNKPVHVDLKGRQLRVIEWANLPYGPIILNHRVKVQLPAKVFFRGDDTCVLKEVVDGNRIYVDPLPKFAVGRGQSINIVGAKVEVEGGLLPLDHAYVEAALRLGIRNFMLSFVESLDDVRELESAIATKAASLGLDENAAICLKIESLAGLEFIKRTNRIALKSYRLMAARDDLMIQIGVNRMTEALRALIQKDSHAICASRLLLGLEVGEVSMADISDLDYMQLLGYRAFMLSDGISRNHFSAAMSFLRNYSFLNKY